MSNRKRRNKLHLETILIPTGNQALGSGNINTTGNQMNLMDGQLGVMVATHDANVPGLAWGDFLPNGTACTDVDAIRIVAGTKNSRRLSAAAAGWDLCKPYKQSAIIHRNKLRSFSFRPAKVGTYNSTGFWNFPTVLPLAQYRAYLELRSVRNDRDFGGAIETVSAVVDTPDFNAFPAITDTTSYLVQNTLAKLNLNSDSVLTSPSYWSKGSRPVIGFAVNISGGAGVPLGTITCGTEIPVMKSSKSTKDCPPGPTTTSTYVANADFVQTVYNWLNDSCAPYTPASTIECIDLKTAGKATGMVTDSMIIMGLDEVKDCNHGGFSNIYGTKVRVDVELGEGFQADPGFECTKISDGFDGYNKGSHWQIRYDERAHGLEYTMQLTGHADSLLISRSGIDPDKYYNAFIIDFFDTEDTLTTDEQAQKRAIILMEAQQTCAPAPTGVSFSNIQPTTVSGLNGALGYWLDSCRMYGNAFSINGDTPTNATPVAPPTGQPVPGTPGSGVYFV